MKTNLTESATTEKLNRALWVSCMGNMSMAADMLLQAKGAITQGQSQVDFVAHCHIANRRKAKAAYLLAINVN